MKLRVPPALAALAAAVAKPFRRSKDDAVTKVAGKTYETPLRDLPSRGHAGPSLYGTGKASARLRRARRRVISLSFTRLLAHKPIGIEAAGVLGAEWRKELAGFQRRWDAAGKDTFRAGRRAAKRAARLAYRRKVKAWKAARAAKGTP